MSYLALARKYRPKAFDDVIGQEPIVATLRNALSSGRVAQAYLLCGPRGTGKTTLARLLAMALNCLKAKNGKGKDKDKGPVVDPCGECDSCRRIADGSDVDVLEIDGASNRGIDEARQIRENAQYVAGRGKHRIYILDEVHMLTMEAFNALLKTLEEPPPHVKFIFATTHPHKLPPTILSRCQRFDFRRIPAGSVAGRLDAVCKAERIDAEPGALALIARAADGGMRDALTLLDQARAFSEGGAVAVKQVRELLGTADPAEIGELIERILAGDAPGALLRIDALWMSGQDLEVYTDQVIDALRERVDRAVAEAAQDASGLGRLLDWIDELLSARARVSPDRMGKVVLELALLKGMPGRAAAPPRAPSAAPVSSKPAALAAMPSGPGPAPSAPPASVPPAGAPGDDLAGWGTFLEKFRREKPSVGAFLAEGAPVWIPPGTIEVAFHSQHKFHREALEKEPNKGTAERALSEWLGKPVRLRTAVAAAGGPSPAGAASGPAPPRPAGGGWGGGLDPDLPPVVRKAAELFKGRVVKHEKRED